ncbi:MAG: hypothetical protein QOD07_466 [Frankiaceae bacterium]|nr:hypothetical protein [Frankiaceae bacterium]
MHIIPVEPTTKGEPMRTRLVVSALVAGAAAVTAVPAMAAPAASAVSGNGPVIVEVGQPGQNCPFGYTGVHGSEPVIGGYEVCTVLPPPQ